MSPRESDFKEQFAIHFLAAVTADRYKDPYVSNQTTERPPVEDAIYLAEKAWEEWERHL